MPTRLLLALTTVLLLVVPTAALAAPAGSPSVRAAASSSEDAHDEGSEGEHADDEAGDHGESEDAHGDEHGMDLDNGDPADAGAQALAGSSGSGFITVMLWSMVGLVVLLMVGGLTLGRGRNA